MFKLLLITLLILTVVKADKVYCSDGKEISSEYLCDGIMQCDDGTDEDPDTCNSEPNEFQCDDGSFIGYNDICNGKANCKDSSDEVHEQCNNKICENNQFKCAYGACINSSLVCDENKDCIDGSDEITELCSKQKKCRLPTLSPSTLYSVQGCFDCQPKTLVKAQTEMKIQCKPGYSTTSRFTTAVCKNGKWLPEIPVCSRKPPNVRRSLMPRGTCKPLVSEVGTVVECNKGITPMNCYSPVPHGTVVQLSCQDYYKTDGKNEAQCLPSGKWSNKVQCKSTCFKGSEVALIVNGQLADTHKSFPWVAGLYALEKGEWTYRCGGTLITDSAMITAAHCIWEMKPEDLKVSLGKKYSDFYNDEPDQQNFEIKRIKVLSVYQDRNGNYGSDLALLIFYKKAVLSDEVHPACIQWDENYSDVLTQPGTFGMVAGWGFTESNKPSDVLRFTKIPIVDSSRCIKEEPQEFRKYITYTSFCAGYENGTSVCNGDSGSGLLFYGNGTWFLEGIVSISPRRTNTFNCEPKLFSVFTKVNMYKRWLNKILKTE